MPIIKPVSDLRNYNEVLACVTANQPVYLTKNGRGKYVILDLDEYNRQRDERRRAAEERLFKELEEAEKCEKFYTMEEIDEEFGL